MEEFEISRPTKKIKSVYISTIISIALVLFVTGLLGLIMVHAKSLSRYVKENIVLNIILIDDAKEAAILSLQKTLDTTASIRHTDYISKDVAAENLQKDLGEDFISSLGFNPLSASLDVYLNADYANRTSIDALTKKLKDNKLIKEVVYQDSLIDMVNHNIRIIGLVILGFACVLLIIAVALINNTIRLAIYSQRFIIKSMQMVGATKGFIRRPFIGYGIWHGVMGALIAILLLCATLYFGEEQIPEIVILRNYIEFALIFAGIFILGVFISGISTFFAVSRFLRLRIHDLYR